MTLRSDDDTDVAEVSVRVRVLPEMLGVPVNARFVF